MEDLGIIYFTAPFLFLFLCDCSYSLFPLAPFLIVLFVSSPAAQVMEHGKKIAPC